MSERTEEEIIKDIARVRRRVRTQAKKLRAVYDEQNALYVEGYLAGAAIAHMAAAGGEEYRVGDQAVRDVIRRAGYVSKPKPRKQRSHETVAPPVGAQF